MRHDAAAALFVMLGQTAERTIAKSDDVAASRPLLISETTDLSSILPQEVRSANRAAEAYKLFFVFESYLRDFLVGVLSEDGTNANWWDKLPPDVKDEVARLEETEEVKSWMAIGSRDRSRLMTYAQLLRVADHCWKDGVGSLIRDKALVQQARLIGHLRNTICHMTEISDEEMDRIRQAMRDWFRVIAP
ncbi:Swt1 family HEPN domain-containing protein [Novilysobacter luteus]|uniref:Swt1 family HEPN domain-containing protein n=1 Tax=Novilysobacter luteus TaxID=2822368 RepID=UPI001BFCA9FC|nr:Swt1 family HEPN domain-containing protein [Lysobacter luteus]